MKNGNPLFDAAWKAGIKAVALYDSSGGRGILPNSYRLPVGDFCGYSGGLGPDNLEEQLPKILEAARLSKF